MLDEAATLITAAGAANQWPELHRLRAQLLLAQGEPVAAQVAIEESLRLAREMNMARDEGIALGIRGQLLAAADADDAFRRSLELLVDEPYEKARTQMAWGLAQQRGGDRATGHALIATAQQTFNHLGAQRELCSAPMCK